MTSHKLGYIPGLDGLRAIAIGGVLMFHLHLVGASLGSLGVQLFFVISGFLITRILLNARSDDHPFRSFYIRRALRIFPIYYLYVLILIAMHLVVGPTDALRTLPFYATYTQNIPSVMLGNGLMASSHTWSLAVEEQFYWLWPMAVLLLAPSRLKLLIPGLIVGAPLWRLLVHVSGANPYLATGTLPSHMDSILVGAAIAAALYFGLSLPALRRIGWSALVFGGTSVVAIAAHIGLEEFWSFRDWTSANVAFLFYTAVAVLFGGVVALVVAGAYPQVLQSKPFMWTGRVSYGIYIYQGLVFFLVDSSTDGLLAPVAGSPLGKFFAIVVKIALTLGLATASWRFIERPALALKDRLAPSARTGGDASRRTSESAGQRS